MKIAVIGSRGLDVKNLAAYLPDGISEIVSGGARGVDAAAAEYARRNGLTLTEFLPDYSRYRRGAPHKRNEQIARYADEAVVLWDGVSRGTLHTMRLFEKLGKKVSLFRL